MEIRPGNAEIKPQWFHPLIQHHPQDLALSKTELETFAYDYFLRFLPFFRNQSDGSLKVGTTITFNRKMRQRLGLAVLFEHQVRLNEVYFAKQPRLLPYTLFHELTHLWLYDCERDPGHTVGFYRKMQDFLATGLPVDTEVHIHTRKAQESPYIYRCPSCQNRWHTRQINPQALFCGYCYDNQQIKVFPTLHRAVTQRACSK